MAYRLKEIRKKHGETQKDLATFLKITPRNIKQENLKKKKKKKKRKHTITTSLLTSYAELIGQLQTGFQSTLLFRPGFHSTLLRILTAGKK